MKNILIGFLLATLLYSLTAFLLPVGVIGATGAYNWNSGLLWCNDTHSCLHEAGHAMDKRLGMPSQSPEFKQAVQKYLQSHPVHLISNPAGFAGKVHLAPGMDIPVPNQFKSYPIYSELYANMYAWASGYEYNMPAEFRGFYDWGNK